MENNNKNQLQEEEVSNPEQFQVKRSPPQEEIQDPATEDNKYTSGEVEFADGEGTQLNEKNGYPDEDDPDEADEDADLENSDDDPG